MTRWWQRASCAGLGTAEGDLFFSEGDVGALPTAMAVMCYECPVKLECRMEGYAESFGYFGNTSADWRVRNRRKIFRRMFPTETLALDGHEALRHRLRALVARCGGDLIKTMYKSGFNRDEITAFATYTPLDERARATLRKQEKQRTNYSWRVAQHTPVGAL